LIFLFLSESIERLIYGKQIAQNETQSLPTQGYHSHYVENILNAVMEALSRSPSRKFVWAEMYVEREGVCLVAVAHVVRAHSSYFSRWFDSKSQETREAVGNYIREGRLEFVEGATASPSPFSVVFFLLNAMGVAGWCLSQGGWVQPDEANTNFDILIHQMTEGHDYLLKHFGVRPRFAWQVCEPSSHARAESPNRDQVRTIHLV